MKNLRISHRIVILIIIFQIGLGAILLILYNSNKVLIESNGWIRHTQDVLTRISFLERNLVDLETGQRGYLLTGDKVYLKPYLEGLSIIDQEFVELKNLASDNRTQIRNLEIIDSLVQIKTEELKLTITLYDSLGYQAAIAVVKTDIGNDIMAEVRGHFKDLRDEEKRLLEERSLGPSAARESTYKNLLLIIGLNLFVVTLFAAGLLFSIRNPIKELEQGAREVATGNLDFQFEEMGNDELGQLKKSFITMVHKLKASMTHNEVLEEEIKNRISAEEQLKQSNKELEQFAYLASHDLKEPLRMVSSYTQLIQKKYVHQLDTKGQKFASYAVDGALRMQSLIDDLLFYSKVSQIKPQLSQVNLREVTNLVKEKLKESLKASEAVLEVKSLPTILVDKALITEVFYNLIENAIKFRIPEKQLKIEIETKLLEDSWLISVCDNGLGISDLFKEKVFEIFKRQHSREKYDGNGIGLALCKRIISNHNGRIWFENNAEIEGGLNGSTFYFTLPIISK